MEKAARNAAEIDTRSAFEYAEKYAGQPWGLAVFQRAFENSPQAASKKFSEISHLIHIVDTPSAKKLIELYGIGIEHKDALLLFHCMVHEGMSLQKAEAIASDPKKLFSELIRLRAIPNVLGAYDIENALNNMSLNIVWRINELHDEQDSVRFKSVEGYDAKTLYTLMVYGEDELFTSSFNGLFNRLLLSMKKERISGEKLLVGIGKNRFRIFIKLCASFNRLNEFLKTMQPNAAHELLRDFAKGIDLSADPLSQAVTVADTFSMITDSGQLKVLQATIKEEYERVSKENNKNGQKLYGLLAGMFGERAVIDQDWYSEMQKKYKLKDVRKIESAELFNEDGSNVQQHFFYNDPSGEDSFNHFLKQYKGASGWRIEDRTRYVAVSGERAGRRVLIYANKPEFEEDGPQEIEKELERKHVKTIVIVHRGHSYHAQKTIERITPRARIVFLGGCGGYNNISAVLSRSPSAHIISTKGRGNMFVNDPLLRQLSGEILEGRNIQWHEFWKRAGANPQLARVPDFKNYVAPHRNLGVMFLKAYHGETNSPDK
ncbi:hypothetical protein HYV58_01590 [Candidatus Peregrinibacteria bacterium]|nr:hypothetical protein [Candidatus Peregrinibacteria bacterium]